MNKIEQYLSIGKVATMLDVAVVTLRRWEKKGKLTAKFRTFGNHRLYFKSDILKLLNMIEEKSPMHNIFVHKEDEGYTSKTSCLTSDVNKNQEKKSKNETILLNDLNGSKGKKLSRGLFKDTVLNVIINSDLNGAANHIRLAFKEVRIMHLKNYLWKLQQPKKIKSVFEFDCFLKQENRIKNELLA